MRFVTEETSPPLTVWIMTLAILAAIGAVVAVLYLVITDPLSYLAGHLELSVSRPMAPRA